MIHILRVKGLSIAMQCQQHMFLLITSENLIGFECLVAPCDKSRLCGLHVTPAVFIHYIGYIARAAVLVVKEVCVLFNNTLNTF